MLMMIKRSNGGKLSKSLIGKVLPDTKRGMRRGRSLWSFITAIVAIALVGLFTIGAGVSYADTTDSLSEPVHHKTIEKHLVNGEWDGTYDLKLTVQGDSKGSTESNPVDIVIIFDKSGSMKDGFAGSGTTSKLTMAKNALTNSKGDGLIDKVLGSNGPDGVKVSLVTFSNTATSSDWYDKSNVNTLKRAVNGIRANGGTNWEDALIKAKAKLDEDTTTSNDQKYVVFLSDGNPTFRISNGVAYLKYQNYSDADLTPYANQDNDGDTPTGVNGNGKNDDFAGTYKLVYDGWDSYWNYYDAYDANGNKKTFHWNYDSAVTAAKSLNMDSSHFFSVKVATEAGKMDNLEKDATNNQSASALDGTTPSNLSNAFDSIVTTITHNQKYAKVTIKDALSNDAEIVPNTTPTVSKTGGKDALPTGNTATVATVDGKSSVSWTIDESGTNDDLEPGATYTLTLNVRPKQDAYDRVMNGRVDTGTNGIFSNDSANTSLTYKTVAYTNNDEGTLSEQKTATPYETPVMDVPTSTITVSKVWDPEKSALSSATVKLQMKVNGAWQDVKDANGSVKTLSLNSDNNWTDTFSVVAGPTGYEYRVVETDPDDANTWTTSYAYNASGESSASKDGITLVGYKAQKATATVTNKQNTVTLTIKKSVTGNFGDTGKSFDFKLNLKNASDQAIIDAAKANNKLSGGPGGDYTFSLKSGTSISVTVPYGTKYVVTEDDPKKGTNDTVDYQTTVTVDNKSDAVSNNDRKASSDGMTKDTTVTFTNNRDVKPDVGVDLGSSAPYAAAIGGIGIAGVAWMILKRRNSQGI
jgi:hypothetical protein